VTQRERMLAGLPYDPNDPGLAAARDRAQRLLVRFNAEPDAAARAAILRGLLGAIAPGVEIRTGFACDYGANIRIGPGSFVNFNCVFLDCAAIEIGARVQIAPAAQLYTATHPLDAAARATGLESALPIRIGDDAWIGGGAIILPGVTVGAGAVVAAGAVVRQAVPPGALVAGNPARMVRRPEGQA
jgi:maltose O-acetyltransferase